jgi:hypothetical protein
MPLKSVLRAVIDLYEYMVAVSRSAAQKLIKRIRSIVDWTRPQVKVTSGSAEPSLAIHLLLLLLLLAVLPSQ